MNYSLDKVRHEPAKVRIGKKGLTEGLILEITTVLKSHPILKIKCLKTIPKESVKLIADNLSKLTESNVLEIRGKTFILQKI